MTNITTTLLILVITTLLAGGCGAQGIVIRDIPNDPVVALKAKMNHEILLLREKHGVEMKELQFEMCKKNASYPFCKKVCEPFVAFRSPEESSRYKEYMLSCIMDDKVACLDPCKGKDDCFCKQFIPTPPSPVKVDFED